MVRCRGGIRGAIIHSSAGRGSISATRAEDGSYSIRGNSGSYRGPARGRGGMLRGVSLDDSHTQPPIRTTQPPLRITQAHVDDVADTHLIRGSSGGRGSIRDMDDSGYIRDTANGSGYIRDTADGFGSIRGAIRDTADGSGSIRGATRDAVDGSESIRGNSGSYRGIARGRGGMPRGVSSGDSHTQPPIHTTQPPLRITQPHVDDVADIHIPDSTEEDNYSDDFHAPESQNGKRKIHFLEPRKKWFGLGVVTRGVSSSIRTHYLQPWMNWKETPGYEKDQWWNIFKKDFKWRPELEQVVRDEFNTTAARRLKGLASSVGTSGKRPDWMSEDVFDRLMQKRSAPGFQVKSQRALRNRKRGAEDGRVVSGHQNGSVSTVEMIQRMVHRNEGIFPTPSQVFLDTHSWIEANGERVYSSQKAKSTMEAYEQRLAENAELGVEEDPAEVWYDIVGGRIKGKVYGLGQSTNFFYENAASSSRSVCTSYISPMNAEIQQRIATYEDEMASMRSQLGEMELFKAKIEALEAILRDRQGTDLCSPAQSQYRLNDDPSSGGGGNSCAV